MCPWGTRVRCPELSHAAPIFSNFSFKKYSKIGSKIKVFFLCGTSLCDTSLFEVEGGQGDVWKVLVTDEQVTLTGGMQEVCIPVSHKFYI